MTPGIHPSNVKMRLRKKLAIRPVKSTANGGKTTQKKYRNAFIVSSCQGTSSPSFLSVLSIIRSLGSPDSTVNRDKAGVAVIQVRRFVLQYRYPCICRFLRCD